MKLLQEVAPQKEFISHHSFNGTWCPSNRLPSSAVHTGCEDRTQLFLTEWDGITSYLTQQHTSLVINKSTPCMCFSLILLWAFARAVKGARVVQRSPVSCNRLHLPERKEKKKDKVISQWLSQQKDIILSGRGVQFPLNPSTGPLWTVQGGRLLIDGIGLLVVCI